MTEPREKWHLQKGVQVSVIIGLIASMILSVYVYANLERDVQENTIGRTKIEAQVQSIQYGVQEIREGLISEGIIKPINK